MKYLSVCSGIEAASAAWHGLGWQPLAFSEIEAFPRAVLAHHYPGVPLHGDFTKLRDESWIADADILVGGTPCQAFSVAGLRKSLDDDRGNLTLEFVRLADAIDDARLAAGRDAGIVVWENVPGVLSVKDNAFGCFLGAMAGEDTALIPTGGKWTDFGVVIGPRRRLAWRVLDAQYFGLAQRRRRVFVVASARDGFDPVAVLSQPYGVQRHSPPQRKAGKGTAHATAPCLTSSGRGVERTGDTRGQDPVVAVSIASTGDISHCLNAGGMGRLDYETETLVAHSPRAEGFDASEDGTGRGTPLVPVAFSAKDHGADATLDLSPTLRAMPHNASHANGGGQMAVAFAQNTRDEVRLQGGDGQIAGALAAEPGMKQTTYVAIPLQEVGKRTGVSTDDPRAGIGIGQIGDPMFTLQAGAQHGVGVSLRGRDGGGTAELGGDVMNALRASQGGGDNPHVLVALNSHGEHHADATQARSIEALRALRRAVGEEAFTVWGFGSLAAFQPAEVLQSALHGGGLRPAAFSRSWMVCCALGGAEHGPGWLLQSLRETGCAGCPPQGWEPPEQLARELGAYLSKLSQPASSAEGFMRDLWLASEGAGVLQQALAAVQAVGRSARREGQPAHATMAVRRLTATECEFLQGFPRGYTNIPWRGKPSAPDGPRYKALGNSMAVPVMRWIGERIASEIARTESHSHMEPAA